MINKKRETKQVVHNTIAHRLLTDTRCHYKPKQRTAFISLCFYALRTCHLLYSSQKVAQIVFLEELTYHKSSLESCNI